MWPFLTGDLKESPREVIPMGPGALLWGRWKLVHHGTSPSFWQGPRYPNSSCQESREAACQEGCLFDVISDPTEQRNLFLERPDVVRRLRRRLKAESAPTSSRTRTPSPRLPRRAPPIWT
ncbi:unnamed protein product [Effrenium voratum]|nr:unnamed protein product [Effrenium voratum]